jgi:RHS repeat-associated protein
MEKFFNEDEEEITTFSVNNQWRFADRRKDEITGYINFGIRDYDPKTARWISSDFISSLKPIMRTSIYLY